jgi:hypothetical protein
MGVEPALGTSCTLNAPFVPMVAEVEPAGTELPEAVEKPGQLISTVPVAGVPSA